MPDDPGIPSEESATVLTECMHCTAVLETRTGEEGVADAIVAGWEIDGAGDLLCPSCAESRADLIGEERVGEMPAPRVWTVEDIGIVLRYAGVPIQTRATVREIMEFCEALPDADVDAACAFGTARVVPGKVEHDPPVFDSPIVIEARAG